MTFWLERGESRFLDLITTSVHGLVEENKKENLPDKYTLFTSGSKIHSLFSLVHPTILESQVKSIASTAQGRYIREFAYALVTLDFCNDVFASKISKIKINKISDFNYDDYTEYIQSGKSSYLANKSAIKFCNMNFGSEQWADFLAEKMLSYGYFCRYLDVIMLLTKVSKKYLKDETIFITQLKNMIGPFDHRVSGSGPDFIQETFKSWAFFTDIININTNGKLNEYDKSKRLTYLKEHSGYISDGNEAYLILRNLKKAKISLNQTPAEKIRIMGFMRLVNLEGWRREFESAVCSALKRVRLLFYLDNRFNTFIDTLDLLNDTQLKDINKYFKKEFNLAEDLLYLECMGYKLEVIEGKNAFSSFTEYIFERGTIEDYNKFLNELNIIWNNCFNILKEDGFMCVVVGDCRGSMKKRKVNGHHGLIPLHCDIISQCRTLGFYLWDIVIHPIYNMNSLHNFFYMRWLKQNNLQFINHDYILVFRKFNPHSFKYIDGKEVVSEIKRPDLGINKK